MSHAIGSYDANGPIYFADTVVMPAPSTLAALSLAHTFTEAEAADVAHHGLFLRVAALAQDAEVDAGIDVGKIAWGAAKPPPKAFDLTVVVVNGMDSAVTSAPGGIDTSVGKNGASFANGSTVTLTATPGPGHTFVGWGADCAGGTVTTDGDKWCLATFM